MRYCPNNECVSTLGFCEANFCYRCGTKMVEKNMKCECGRTLGEVDIYCQDCGKKTERKKIK